MIQNKCYNTCFYLHGRFRIRKFFLVRHDTLRRLSRWAEPIYIWISMPNMENFYYDFTTIELPVLVMVMAAFYVLWRFWYHLMVTRSKGRYQYWCMITYPWFIHSFIQYFNFVDHQNFLRNTQLSRHSRKKHGRIEHQFYLLFMCFIL